MLQTNDEFLSQLLELLLDTNNSNQIPGHQRIELSLESPSINSVPALVASIPPIPNVKSRAETGEQIYQQLLGMIDGNIQSKLSNKPTKSLALLMANTPHRPFEITSKPPQASTIPGIAADMARDLELSPSYPEPVAYLSPDRIDEYLAAVDASLHLPPVSILHNPDFVPTPNHISEKDLAVRNPVSVYNWLRAHEPKIFLQDGETQAFSEKSLGKPGALRGAGKRASIPAPSRPDTVEFVEEDGIGYDVSLSGTGGGTGARDRKGSANGKRKRASEEDAGYRPKGGVSRPTKKKKKEGSGESASSRRSSLSKSKMKLERDVEMDIEESPPYVSNPKSSARAAEE